MRMPSALARNGVIAVAENVSAQSNGNRSVEAPHGVFYMRRGSVGLFRFNPNYPEMDETVGDFCISKSITYFRSKSVSPMFGQS